MSVASKQAYSDGLDELFADSCQVVSFYPPLNTSNTDAFSDQIAAGGTFSLTDAAGRRRALVLEIPAADDHNTPIYWAGAAREHGLAAAVLQDEWNDPCRVVLPLGCPLPEEAAAALAARLVDRFGGEGFGTTASQAPTLRVDPEADVDFAEGVGCDFVDRQLAAEDVAREAEAGTDGKVAPKERKSSRPLERLNETHAIVHVRGVACVLTEYDGGISLTDEAKLHPRYANDLRSQDGSKWEPISKIWLRWKNRREYPGGLGFWPDPSAAPAGSYNLWRGWSVEPDPSGSCDLFLAHLRAIVCRDDNSQFRWLLGWMAHLVQRPGEKPRSAIVLKGCKGAGKDTVAVYLSRLLPGSAYLGTSSMAHLTGTFNAAIANKLLLHLEEGFWSGDRSADSSLKNLITARTLVVNEKFEKSYTVDSYHRLIVTSNEARVVNATEGERRYFIAELDPRHAKDPAYFDALYAEMYAGGPAALMHLLRTFDLTGWRNEPPATETLREHVLDGLRGIAAWWYGTLQSGELPGDTVTIDEDGGSWGDGPRTVSASSLYRDYVEWVRGRRFEGDPVNDGTFGRELRKLLGGLTAERRQVDGVRDRSYAVPSLAECRRAFDRALR